MDPFGGDPFGAAEPAIAKHIWIFPRTIASVENKDEGNECTEAKTRLAWLSIPGSPALQILIINDQSFAPYLVYRPIRQLQPASVEHQGIPTKTWIIEINNPISSISSRKPPWIKKASNSSPTNHACAHT